MAWINLLKVWLSSKKRLLNLRITNTYCSKPGKSSVAKEEMIRKLILISQASHNWNWLIFRVLSMLKICTNLPKWSSEHQREILSCTLSIHLHKLILTPFQDQLLLLLSNLVMFWSIKLTGFVKVSMLKNTDFLQIKIKSLIKLNKLKTVLLILNNSGQWLKKV